MVNFGDSKKRWLIGGYFNKLSYGNNVTYRTIQDYGKYNSN